MEYRYCGHSGLKLPVVSLGLWHNFGDTSPISTQREIITGAFDRGITHFDLANNYGPKPGSAESNFGQILRNDLRGHRDEIVITTKAGHLMWPGPYGDGSSRKHLMASIDQSLKRLGVDYVDIFYSHRYNPDTPLEETMQALADIVRAGKALYIGLSKYPADVAERACDILQSFGVRCLVYQDKFNMLNRSPELNHRSLIEARGLGFVAFSPLAQGLLTGRYLNGIPAGSRVRREGGFLHEADLTEAVMERTRRLDALAKGRGQTLAEMALSWLLHKPWLTSVIVGVSSLTQLDDNLAAIGSLPFTDEDLTAIDALCC